MDSAKEYKNILKDSVIFAIGTFGSKVVTFLFVPLYTSYLTTEEYGTADLVYMAVSLLFPIFTLSISEATLRFCYQKDVNTTCIFSIFINVVVFATILNTAISGIVSLFVPFIRPYLIYYIPLFLLCALEGGMSNYMKGIGEVKIFAAQGVVHTSILVLANIVLLVIFKWGLCGYFISMMCSSMVAIIFMIVSGKLYRLKLSFDIDKQLLKQMLKYSMPMVPATMAWWINISADKYMISWFVGVGANGLYSVAHMIPTILTTVTGLFTQSWQLSAMRNYGTEDYPALFSNVVKSVNTLLVIGSALLILACQVLAKLMFRNEFYEAWECVPFLVLSSVFSVMAATLASAYMASKKTNILFYSTCSGAVINILCNFLLIPTFGIIGAAISTCVSFLVMVLIRQSILKRNIVKLDLNMWGDILNFGILLVECIIISIRPTCFYIISVTCLFILSAINYKQACKITLSLFKLIRFRK